MLGKIGGGDTRQRTGTRSRTRSRTCSPCFDHRIDAYSKRNIGLLVAHASGQPCQILKHALGWVDCVSRFLMKFVNSTMPSLHGSRPCTEAELGSTVYSFTSRYCLDYMLIWTRQARGEHFPEHCLTTPWSVEENLPLKKTCSCEAQCLVQGCKKEPDWDGWSDTPPINRKRYENDLEWLISDALSVTLTLRSVYPHQECVQHLLLQQKQARKDLELHRYFFEGCMSFQVYFRFFRLKMIGRVCQGRTHREIDRWLQRMIWLTSGRRWWSLLLTLRLTGCIIETKSWKCMETSWNCDKHGHIIAWSFLLFLPGIVRNSGIFFIKPVTLTGCDYGTLSGNWCTLPKPGLCHRHVAGAESAISPCYASGVRLRQWRHWRVLEDAFDAIKSCQDFQVAVQCLPRLWVYVFNYIACKQMQGI